MITSRTAAVSVALLALNACASVRPDMSSLLIKQGEPTVSYDAPDAPERDKPKPITGDVPALDSSQRERTASTDTVERTDKALGRALAELRIDESVSSHLRVAREYRRIGILDKAYEHATAALEGNRRSVEALEQRAQIWRKWGFPHLGLTDAYRAVFLAPNSPSAQNTLGNLLQAIGQTDAARKAYERVVAIDPRAAYGWSNLCYLSLLSGSHVRAESECKTALRIAPRLQVARNNLALSYATAGRLDKARAELASSGSRADSAFNLGMLYLALGQYQSAEQSFRLASDIRPNHVAAATRRRQAARLAAATADSQQYSHHPYDNSPRP